MKNEISGKVKANLFEDHWLVSGGAETIGSLGRSVNLQHCRLFSVVGVRDEVVAPANIHQLAFRPQQDDALPGGDILQRTAVQTGYHGGELRFLIR